MTPDTQLDRSPYYAPLLICSAPVHTDCPSHGWRCNEINLIGAVHVSKYDLEEEKSVLERLLSGSSIVNDIWGR